ncbi:MAG TPA: DMT family transporter [Xanthobacteraceae bacterium]|jgi:drug/metabolite transporter (DMT)-like permease|nr:DMT family transporter [Xanthobacteraceae bacterium]
MPRTFEDVAIFAAPGVFVVLWASGFIGAKLGLPYAEPLTFLALRMFGVVVLLGLFMLIAGAKWPGREGALDSYVTGVLMHALYLGGVYISIAKGLPAALSALVVGLQPLLTSTIANRLLGERVAPRQWVGLVLGLSGVYLVVQDKATVGAATPLAWIAAVVGLVAITIGTVYQKRFGSGIDWRPAMFIQYAAAGILFALGATAFESRSVRWTPEFLFALGWLVFVLSFGAIWLLYFLIRRAAATRVVSLFYLTPPVTALMAWSLFGERLAPLALVGMAVCVAGVFLANWRIDGKNTR